MYKETNCIKQKQLSPVDFGKICDECGAKVCLGPKGSIVVDPIEDCIFYIEPTI